ncbi:MAG: hypothetical protein JRJ12_04915 [Deltaproteobacteria bacterium]|nr:hypothetical protein [Deltaproteobacteria bacterium]MBW2072161.1 hypothetical protein [Deltaproteobacteria bacterium]
MTQGLSSYVLATGAFALFIVCPRMAAMTNIVHKQLGLNLLVLVLLGTLASIPLLLVMVLIIQRWGLMAGLAFCVITDLLAALVMQPVSTKAAIETFIIAIFVVVGNRLAAWLTAHF